MLKSFVNGLVIGLIVCWQSLDAIATGVYGPPPKALENGGVALTKTPEFYWKEQMILMAQAFIPPEKRVERKLLPAAPGESRADEREAYSIQTARMDIDEFHEAIAKGYLKPTDPAAAEAAHARQRFMICPDAMVANPKLRGDGPVAEEYDSEFSDYHRGALAFRDREFDKAITAWQTLLARPKSGRHYRSVWAAYMLGRCAIEQEREEEAVKWFQQTRALAKDGFADGPGLAADSYGWEALAEWTQDHQEQAAKLYLTQLATGDESAVFSLKSLIPDWYNGGTTAPATPGDKSKQGEPTLEQVLVKVANAPLLRRIMTAHVLATETIEEWAYEDNSTDAEKSRSHRWLKAINDAHIHGVEDSDSLGWVAYASGDYKAAKGWLDQCTSGSALSLWLRTKFLQREGKLDEALKTMQKSVDLLDKSSPPLSPFRSYYYHRMLAYRTTMSTTAHADLATLYLGHGDFDKALGHFEHTLQTTDWAYVAERLLTTDELIQHVEKTFPWGPAEQQKAAKVDFREYDTPDPPPGLSLRHLLAKRLVREDRYDEARRYMPEQYRAQLDEYVNSLNSAANPKLTKMKRARAYFHAAALLMNHGWEIMATTGEPDSIDRGTTSMNLERETGKLMDRSTNNQFVEARTGSPLQIRVPVTKEEKRRLAQNKIVPFRAGHFRYVALGLVWKSAALLPDNTDELADILNTSGNWIRGDAHGDDETAENFFQAIEHRASRTVIGKAAGAKHWFVENRGPWSSEELKPDQ